MTLALGLPAYGKPTGARRNFLGPPATEMDERSVARPQLASLQIVHHQVALMSRIDRALLFNQTALQICGRE